MTDFSPLHRPLTDSHLAASDADDSAQELDGVELIDDDTQSSYDRLEQLFSTVRLPPELARGFEDTDHEPPVLSGFTITELLGHGGFGRVYLAKDERLGRQVAVKVPYTSCMISDEATADHFLDEARLIATLQHPGIVTLYDVVTQDGQCHLISEYVTGGTLEDRLTKGPISLDDAVSLTSQLADALAHAHSRNIVHRDLKPRNILIDQQGSPRITDFGLAIRDDQQQTDSAQSAGTQDYLAPEQLPDRRHYIDGRTDIWALGVILYRMLTGQLPFQGRHEALFDQIANRSPKPPRQLNPAIPAALEAICLICLEKNPDHRFASATELQEALERTCASTAPRTTHWIVLTAGVILVSLVANGLWHSRSTRDETAPHLAAVSPAASAPAPLAVEQFHVQCYRYADDTHGTFLGIIGKQVSQAEFDDDVRIALTLSAPAYTYLLEFSSDGQMYLQSPESGESTPPERQHTLTIPSESASALGLHDGIGQHVFCVLASTTPLPPFAEWKTTLGDVPWEPTMADGTWHYSSRGGITSGTPTSDRSVPRDRPGAVAPQALIRLCQHLSDRAPEMLIEALAFPVVAKPIDDAQDAHQ